MQSQSVSSVTQSCLILCNPMDCIMARLPCLSPTPRACSNSCTSSQWCHQPSHPLSPPSLPALSLSQHQGLFQWVSSLHQVAKVLELQLYISLSNEYSGLISFKMDWLDLLAVQGTLQESSPALQFKSISSSALSHLYGPTFTSIHNYWKKHSFD